MTRFIMPIILVVVAIAVFFVLTNPLYGEITVLRTEMASYDEALNNSKALESERDKLTAKYNTIDMTTLTRLQKFLPENVDNIRLILEIEQIASPYGMVLKDVKYNVADTATPSAGVGLTGLQSGTARSTSKDYGVFDLEFSTSGTYNNFVNFTRDLESNLRVVDISSVSFTSDAAVAGVGGTRTVSDVYKYNFKIRTYWLKN